MSKAELGRKNREAVAKVLREKGDQASYTNCKASLKQILGSDISETTFKRHKDDYLLKKRAEQVQGPIESTRDSEVGKRVANTANPQVDKMLFSLNDVKVVFDLEILAKQVGGIPKLEALLGVVKERQILRS